MGAGGVGVKYVGEVEFGVMAMGTIFGLSLTVGYTVQRCFYGCIEHGAREAPHVMTYCRSTTHRGI